MHVSWIVVLFSLARVVFATDDSLFEQVQSGAYADMLSQATIAYDKHDYDRAFALNRRTACGGDKTSQAIVGRMYVLGQGTPRDEITGYAWIKLAAEFSYADYTSLARKLEVAMTPEQRTRATAQADAMRKSYGLAATGMSCHAESRRGAYLLDSVVCTPQSTGGGRLELRRCVDEGASTSN
jgi:FOG: TPR repeat, SEL1 subfamily